MGESSDRQRKGAKMGKLVLFKELFDRRNGLFPHLEERNMKRKGQN